MTFTNYAWNILNYIKDNPYTWLILTIIPILQQRTKHSKKTITYAKSTYEVIKKHQTQIQNLRILFGDDDIENLSITKIAVWNSGNTTINKQDIVTLEPIEIPINEGVKLLSAEIVVENEATNQFVLNILNDNSIVLDFDYCSSKQGVVIQVIHTGKAEDILPLKGKIKDGNLRTYNLRIEKIPLRKLIKSKTYSIITLIYQLISIILVALFLNIIYFRLLPKEIMDLWIYGEQTLINTLSVILINAMVGLSIWLVYKTLNTNVPNKLRVYSEYNTDNH